MDNSANISSLDFLEDRLAASEALIPNIRPGLAKEIIWADPARKRKTALSLVYIHGFSASKGEVRPLPDIVARELGANLFYTRLNGHGVDSSAMGEATIADWQRDVAEALDIGTRLGERVLIMATSTGATLCAEAFANRVAGTERVAAAVFLAPNFGIRARSAALLTAPFARQIAHLLIGKNRSFQPINALHAAYWTNSYPVEALLPVARLVKRVRSLPLERIEIPALFVASEQDQVISPKAAIQAQQRWGGPSALFNPGPVGDPYGHLPAGDALSPATTNALAEEIIKWIRKTL